MKNAITLLILAGFFLSFETKNIDLEDVKVKPTESFTKSLETANDEFLIPEELNDLFEVDALDFVCRNFKMKDYLEENDIGETDSYEVTFRSRKGFLRATYDANCAMVRSSQRFKDAPLPYDVRNQIYSEYKGWDITSSTFVARGTGEKIDKSFYRIRLANGNQKERIKIFVNNSTLQNSGSTLANN
jgi:hypothetical protein